MAVIKIQLEFYTISHQYIQNILQASKKINSSIHHLLQCTSVFNQPIRLKLNQLYIENESLVNKITILDSYLKQSYHNYYNLELSLERKANNLSSLKNIQIATLQNLNTIFFKPTLYDWYKQIIYQNLMVSQIYKSNSLWQVNFAKVYKNGYSNIQWDTILSSLIKNNLISVGEMDAFLLSGEYRNRINRKNYSFANVGFGNLLSQYKCKGVLHKQGVIDPNFDFDVGVDISLLKGSALYRHTHNKNLVEVGASANLLASKTEAKANITKKEITLKGEVGASAANAKIHSEFRLFGLRVKVEAEAIFGGIGIGANFSIKEKSFAIGGKFSSLFGGGWNIEFSW